MQGAYAGFLDYGFLRAEGAKMLGERRSGINPVATEIANWFRQLGTRDLRPLSELHDEFAKRPAAESLLADAEQELTYRERNDAGYVERHAGVRSDGSVTCWGRNTEGQTDGPSGSFTAVSAGGWHSCGLRTDSTVTCWGDNSGGQADAPSDS